MYKTQLETARLACTSPRSGSAPERSGEAVASPVGAHREDEQSVAAIHRALEEGIHWIDTAAGSGFGQSEEVVGRALNSLAAKPYFVTNCSLLEVPAGRAHSLHRRIQQIAPAETLQPEYLLDTREVEGEILASAEQEGVGVIVSSPMGSEPLTGMLTRAPIEQLADDEWPRHHRRGDQHGHE